jgi:hypothetical protein
MRLEPLNDEAVHVIKHGFRENIQSTPEATLAILRMSATAQILR